MYLHFQVKACNPLEPVRSIYQQLVNDDSGGPRHAVTTPRNLKQVFFRVPAGVIILKHTALISILCILNIFTSMDSILLHVFKHSMHVQIPMYSFNVHAYFRSGISEMRLIENYGSHMMHCTTFINSASNLNSQITKENQRIS